MSCAPLLSVCVPTFNRRALLAENLQTLLPQAAVLGVEVCISDNASHDDTTSLLQAVSARYPRVRIVRQHRNVGLDANMLAVIGMSTGQYVFPLGDDDVVPEGQLRNICESLTAGPDLLVLDGWHTDAQLVPQRRHLDSNTAGRCWDSPAESFVALWDKMPFGAFLATRECFTAERAARYLGTSHAYTGVVWDSLARRHATTGRIAACGGLEAMVLIRGASKTWSSRAAFILLNEIPMWFDLVAQEPAYTAVASSIRCRYLAERTSNRALLALGAQGQLPPKHLALLTQFCSAAQSRKISAVSRIPPACLRVGLNAARLLRGRRPRCF